MWFSVSRLKKTNLHNVTFGRFRENIINRAPIREIVKMVLQLWLLIKFNYLTKSQIINIFPSPVTFYSSIINKNKKERIRIRKNTGILINVHVFLTTATKHQNIVDSVKQRAKMFT